MSIDATVRRPDSPSVPSAGEIETIWRIAVALAKAGIFKDLPSAERAFGKMIIGRDFGLTPAQSIMSLDVVDGNISVRYPMLGQWVRARPGYDYRLREHTDQVCVIEYFREGESLGTSSFSVADAEKANLLPEANPRKPWNTARRNMLFARAMSNGCKWIVPEVLNGLPVYVEEEAPQIEALDGEPHGEVANGENFDAEAVEAAITTHLPTEQLATEAWELIDEMNRLAPNSWTAGKVEMLFKGCNVEKANSELDHIGRAINELRARETDEITAKRIGELERALDDRGLTDTQRADVQAELEMLSEAGDGPAVL